MIQELKPEKDVDRTLIERRIRAVLDGHGGDFAGFALVVWNAEGASTADMANREPRQGAYIPAILIPDFVRNRLLGMKIEEWAVDTIRGRNV